MAGICKKWDAILISCSEDDCIDVSQRRIVLEDDGARLEAPDPRFKIRSRDIWEREIAEVGSFERHVSLSCTSIRALHYITSSLHEDIPNLRTRLLAELYRDH